MKVRSFIYILCFIFFTAVFADTLNWQDCLKLAEKNNKSLLIAKEKINQYQLNKQTVQSGFYPQVSAGLSQQTGHQKNPGPPEVDEDTKSYSYSLSAKQLVYDGFKTAAQAAAADKDLQAIEYDYAVTESDLRLNLRTAFIELLKAQEQLSITEKIKARRQQNMDLIKLRYQAGREHKGSLLVAEANLAQAVADVTQASRSIELARAHLIRQIGSATLNITEVTENELPVVDPLKPDFQAITEQNPLLKELIVKIDAASKNLEALKADQLPQVYANYKFGKSDDEWPPENEQWSLGLSVSLTLWDANKNGANAAKSASTLKQTHWQAQDGRESVLYTLADTWSSLQNSSEDLTVSKKFLEAAEERAKIADAQYSSGLITFDNWIIIEDNLVSSRKDYLNTKTNLLLAQARWVQAKGGGLNEK